MTKFRLLTIPLLAGAALLGGGNAAAQSSGNAAFEAAGLDQEIRLLRKDLRSEKKQIVASNLELTDEEAQRFWPVYDRFARELAAINDKKVELLQEYARSYDRLTGEQADSFLARRAAIEAASVELRQKYIPAFRKVLSGKSTALFFQIEWRVSMMADLQIASEIPLIEP